MGRQPSSTVLDAMASYHVYGDMGAMGCHNRTCELSAERAIATGRLDRLGAVCYTGRTHKGCIVQWRVQRACRLKVNHCDDSAKNEERYLAGPLDNRIFL